MRNKQLNSLKDILETFSVSDEELPYLLPTIDNYVMDKNETKYDLEIPDRNNFSEACVSQTGQLANDISVASYLMMSNNSELVNFNISNHFNVAYPVSLSAARNQMLSEHRAGGLHKIVGGFEDLISRIIFSLSSMKNVELQLNQRVKRVSECSYGFSVTSDKGPNADQQYTSQQVIFACGLQGLRYCSVPRPHQIQKLTEKVRMAQGFRLCLTYKRAWWEDYGLYRGAIVTDRPNKIIIAFGQEGKSATHATIMVAFTNQNLDILESLDYETLERFRNKEGNISQEQTPSKILVDFLQQQLKIMLGKTVCFYLYNHIAILNLLSFAKTVCYSITDISF